MRQNPPRAREQYIHTRTHSTDQARICHRLDASHPRARGTLKEDMQVDRDGFMYPSAYLKLPGMTQGVRPDQGWAYNPGREQARWDRAGLLPD